MADSRFWREAYAHLHAQLRTPWLWICGVFAVVFALASSVLLPILNGSDFGRESFAGFTVGFFLSLCASAFAAVKRGDNEFAAELAGWVLLVGLIGAAFAFCAGLNRLPEWLGWVVLSLVASAGIFAWALMTALDVPPRIPVADKNASKDGLAGSTP